MTRTVTRPRNGGHHYTVVSAAHPWRLRLDEAPHRAQIEMPPAPSSVAPVIAGAPLPALAAAPSVTPPQPYRNHDRSQLPGVALFGSNVLHHRPLHAE